MKKNLHELVGKSLERIAPNAETVRRLLDAATRCIADAKISVVSTETRFVSAYAAVRILADVGLHANGLRTRASVPGHHCTAIQSLVLTMNVDERSIARLDQLRKQRNAAEYSGDLIPSSAVTECVRQAEVLSVLAVEWLKTHKPELLRPKRRRR